MKVVEGNVERVSVCDLRVVGRAWPYMHENAAAIDAHWQARTAANPRMFNGRIYVLASSDACPGRFSGELIKVDFKSFLHWKDSGYPDAGVHDVFGSALIRSAEGHVLLGRQRAGNLNAGLAYPPGGFIDERDVGDGLSIDIRSSTARELAEETGLDPRDFAIAPGYWLTRIGPMVSFACEFRSPLGSRELRAAALHAMGSAPDDELADLVVVRGVADLDGTVAPFARALVAAVFAADASGKAGG